MSTASDNIFKEKVVPVMDQVRSDLQSKQAKEMEEHLRRPEAFLSLALGPDGGASTSAAYTDSIRVTGNWNSKTVEDYVSMVKAELKKRSITVTPEIEKKMIEKMVDERVPKSSIEYLIKKSAQSSLFNLPQEVRKSPLEQQLDAQAEKKYAPSALEKNAGIAIGSAADWLSTGGLGGGVKAAATWIGTDMLINHVTDNMNDHTEIPSFVAPGQEEAYRKEQKKSESKTETKKQETEVKTDSPEPVQRADEAQAEVQESQTEQTQSDNKNVNGWNGLLTSFGLNGITDVTHNLGYVLAMLPDFLVGMFTGKSRMNIKDNLMPIASIAAGMFVKNPLLKMVLISMGGMNLLNKAGHETLENHQGNVRQAGSNYKVYPDEPLNSRITNPKLQGNCLIADIDRVPCTITLPQNVIEAYRQGALPLNTLANAVLAKNDQMNQMASQNYERHEQMNETRTLAQR